MPEQACPEEAIKRFSSKHLDPGYLQTITNRMGLLNAILPTPKSGGRNTDFQEELQEPARIHQPLLSPDTHKDSFLGPGTHSHLKMVLVCQMGTIF